MTIRRRPKLTERLFINMTYEDREHLEAMRAGSGIDSLPKFVRSLLLEIIRDDKAAEKGEREEAA